jgi:hypothetical protein
MSLFDIWSSTTITILTPQTKKGKLF